MAFSSNSGGGAMADINVTPLVDVMLVLLIIFMVTMPIQTYPIKIDLPTPSDNPPPPVTKDPIKLRVDSAGQMFWNESMVPDARQLEQIMKDEVAKDPAAVPQLQIETANDTPYEAFARVLAAAKNAQMEKIGFVEN